MSQTVFRFKSLEIKGNNTIHLPAMFSNKMYIYAKKKKNAAKTIGANTLI